MFTGIVVEIGRLSAEPVPSGQGGLRLLVAHSAALGTRLGIGDSLAVAGVCLTVIASRDGETRVEVSPATLARTTLAGLRAGHAVNLEPALRVGEPLGGAGFGTLADSPRLEDLASRKLGRDLILTAERSGCLPELLSKLGV